MSCDFFGGSTAVKPTAFISADGRREIENRPADLYRYCCMVNESFSRNVSERNRIYFNPENRSFGL